MWSRGCYCMLGRGMQGFFILLAFLDSFSNVSSAAVAGASSFAPPDTSSPTPPRAPPPKFGVHAIDGLQLRV